MIREWEILLALSSPLKSFRLLAAERITDGPASPVLLEALQTALETEEDAECILLMQQALRKVGAGAEKKISPSPRRVSDLTLDNWEKLDEAQRLDCLFLASSEEIKTHAEFLMGMLDRNPEPVLAATIIRRLTRFWPEDRLGDLASRLYSPGLSPRLAALEALIQRKPALLKKDLPRLLISDDLRLRALAVRGLAALDLDESLKFLDFTLFRKGDHERLAGLQNLLLFPFEEIKPLLFKFFAVEENPDFLSLAGVIFEANADLEVPFKLWAIAEKSSPEKAALLKEIIRRACQVIEQLGLGRQGEQNYSSVLQEWIEKRAARRFMQDLVLRLEQEPAEDQHLLEMAVRAMRESSQVRDALQQALTWPVKPETREWLQRVFLREAEAAGRLPEQALKPGAFLPVFQKWSTREKLVFLSGAAEGSRPQWSQVLDAVCVESSAEDPEVNNKAWGVAGQFKQEKFLPVALNLARQSPLPGWGLLEYLETMAPDSLKGLETTLLEQADVRVMAVGLRLMARGKILDAVQYLTEQLICPDPARQIRGIRGFAELDFSLARASVAGFLRKCHDPRAYADGLRLFQTNMSPENLYDLLAVSRLAGTSAFREMAENVLRETESHLLEEGFYSPEALSQKRQDLERRFSREQKMTSAPAPAYSFSFLKPQLQSLAESGLSALQQGAKVFIQNIREKKPTGKDPSDGE